MELLQLIFLCSVEMVIGVKNGFPNLELGKPLPPLEPLTLDINIESSTDNINYLEQVNQGIYTPSHGYGFHKIVQQITTHPGHNITSDNTSDNIQSDNTSDTSLDLSAGFGTLGETEEGDVPMDFMRELEYSAVFELIYQSTDLGEYVKEVICTRVFSRVHVIILFLFNGDVGVLNQLNKLWTLTNKLILNITNQFYHTDNVITETPGNSCNSCNSSSSCKSCVGCGITTAKTTENTESSENSENSVKSVENENPGIELGLSERLSYYFDSSEDLQCEKGNFTEFTPKDYNSISKIVYKSELTGLELVIWQAQNWFENAKNVTLTSVSDVKYLLILQVDNNYRLFKWDQKMSLWLDITLESPDLSQLPLEINNKTNSAAKMISNYEVYIKELNYCVKFHYSSEVMRRYSAKLYTSFEYNFLLNSVNLSSRQLFNTENTGEKRVFRSLYGRGRGMKEGVELDISVPEDINYHSVKNGNFTQFLPAHGYTFSKVIQTHMIHNNSSTTSSRISKSSGSVIIWSSFVGMNYVTEVQLYEEADAKYLLLYTKKKNYLLYKWEKGLWINITGTLVDPQKLTLYHKGNPIDKNKLNLCIREFSCEIITERLSYRLTEGLTEMCDCVSYDGKCLWLKTRERLAAVVVKILENKVNLFFQNGKVWRFQVVEHIPKLIKQGYSHYQTL